MLGDPAMKVGSLFPPRAVCLLVCKKRWVDDSASKAATGLIRLNGQARKSRTQIFRQSPFRGESTNSSVDSAQRFVRRRSAIAPGESATVSLLADGVYLMVPETIPSGKPGGVT